MYNCFGPTFIVKDKGYFLWFWGPGGMAVAVATLGHGMTGSSS